MSCRARNQVWSPAFRRQTVQLPVPVGRTGAPPVPAGASPAGNIPSPRINLLGRTLLLSLCLLTLTPLHAATNLLFNSPSQTTLRIDGFVAERVRLTTENWLIPAPIANPGMIEMFQVRDREPAPNLVPWAGEFIGKY